MKWVNQLPLRATFAGSDHGAPERFREILLRRSARLVDDAVCILVLSQDKFCFRIGFHALQAGSHSKGHDRKEIKKDVKTKTKKEFVLRQA